MKERDQALIAQKLAYLKRSLAELEPHLKVSARRFESNLTELRAVERLTQIIVECAIDASSLLIEALNWPPVEHARGSFQRLNEYHVLDDYVTNRYVVKYVELRNVIVHLYEKVEPKTLYYSARRLLKDSDEYARQIHKFLTKQK